MKTILGYNDKTINKYGTIESKLPMLIDERYEPFLVTSKQFITIRTQQISQQRQKFQIQESIRTFKNILSTILIIPGTLAAIIYTINFFLTVSNTAQLPINPPEWLTNLTFWLAVFGTMILWHDTYRTQQIRTRIQEPEELAEQDVETIRRGQLNTTRLQNVNCIDTIDNESERFINASIIQNQISIYLLLENLLKDPDIIMLLRRSDIESFKDELGKNEITPKKLPAYPLSSLRSILIYAAEEAILTGSDRIETYHLFITLFKVFPVLIKYLKRQKLNIQVFRHVSEWIIDQRIRSQKTRIFNPNIPYYRTGGIADSWIYGYTYVLSHYSKDLTQAMAKEISRYGIGHESEMDEIFSTLSKVSKNNVLLIGESGTGKSSIAKGLAQRINQGKVPKSLQDMRIIQLDINSLIAGSSNHGNLEALIQTTMKELSKAGNSILYIDEIQEIIPTKDKDSQQSIAGILLPYILDNKFPIIGTITYADYKKFFYANESLRQSFQKIEIREVSPEAAFEILTTRVNELEEIYDIEIRFPAILTSIELAQRYVYDRKLPDSAVNIIESSCASLQNNNEKILKSSHVSRTVSTMTQIPVEDVSAEEATNLLTLEEKMKEQVIGQDDAIHQIVEALKRARTGIRDRSKPIGTFLFLGPTGVGKTHLAKTIAKEYFSNEKDLIRLDMSEYKEISSIEKILGSTDSNELSQTSITLLDQVKRNPYTVVLLDEIEKAHTQVLDLFLQLLDEGRLTSNTGETVNFNNTVIICTSNIGSKTLLDSLEKDETMFEEAKDRVILELRQKVKIEFLNRFDKIIVFAPHNMDNLEKIAILLLKNVRLRLMEKEITIDWEDGVARLIASKAYQPGLGARPIRRFIQDNIEGLIATKMLQGEIQTGSEFTIMKNMIE
ncbi:ATP-dependent Clp protease ATP-binding subunit [Candidatus Dojkabacteria bacterium]|nr:ATP-dependent Clp protease ATP-binding subunit [Candidatus Dojkabacteria bacterium]